MPVCIVLYVDRHNGQGEQRYNLDNVELGFILQAVEQAVNRRWSIRIEPKP